MFININGMMVDKNQIVCIDNIDEFYGRDYFGKSYTCSFDIHLKTTKKVSVVLNRVFYRDNEKEFKDRELYLKVANDLLIQLKSIRNKAIADLIKENQ